MGCGSSSERKQGRVYGGSKYGGRSTVSSSLYPGTSSYVSSTTHGHGSPAFFLHHNRNFPGGEANQGSLKKRLKRQLAFRIKAGTQPELEETLKMCEEFRIPADDLYFQAVRRVEYLRVKNALKEAVRRRHYSTLRDAISKAENSSFSSQLTNSLQTARNVLDDLAYLWTGEPMRHSMGYSTVSEVRRFKSPPASVIDSIKACYLIVGTQSSKVKTWPAIRTLLCKTGKDGILMQMAKFDPGRLPLQTYKLSDSLIRKWEEKEVARSSIEAASFWAWANSALNRKYNQIGRKHQK